MAGFGLIPIKRRDGSPYNGDVNEYAITASTAAIYQYAPVKLHTDGTVISAAATDPILGSFMGCKFKRTAGGRVEFSRHWPAVTTAVEIKAQVADSPDLVYKIKTGSAFSTVTDPTIVGLNAEIVVPGTPGDAITGQSAVELGAAVTGTTSGVLKIQALSGDAINGGTEQPVEVICVNHVLLKTVSRA